MFKSVLNLVLLTALLSSAQALISFDKTEVDIGIIKESDGVQTIPFLIQNKGTAPLIISDVTTSCGCMVSDYVPRPIPKDSSIVLKIKINPHNRPGYFNKTVSLTSNTKPDINLLTIKGIINAKPRNPKVEYPVKRGSLRFIGNGFNIGSVTTEKPLERSLEVYNESDKDVTLLDRTDMPAHIKLLSKGLVMKPKEVSFIKIVYDAKTKNDFGYVNDYIELYTDSKEDSLLPLSVFGTIEDYFPPINAKELATAPKIQVEKQDVYLGRYGKGTEVQGSFTIKNVGQKPLLIKKIKPSCSCVSASMGSDHIQKQQAEVLNFKINTRELAGNNIKTVTLFTNDPIKHVLVLTIRFDVF